MEHTKNLPKKLTAIIADTDNVFIVRIGTEPRTTDTGIANVIPANRDISRQGRDRTVQIAKHFVNCWNGWDELKKQRDDLLDACREGKNLLEDITGGDMTNLENDVYKQITSAIQATKKEK